MAAPAPSLRAWRYRPPSEASSVRRARWRASLSWEWLGASPQLLLADLDVGDVAHDRTGPGAAASASMAGTIAPLLSKRIS